jgi:hypothetical protein
VPYKRAKVYATLPEEELLKLRAYDNAKLPICDGPDVRLLTLKVSNFQSNGAIDPPIPCTLVIDADATRAEVVNEDECAGFHGTAADFAEQGRNLIRVP